MPKNKKNAEKKRQKRNENKKKKRVEKQKIFREKSEQKSNAIKKAIKDIQAQQRKEAQMTKEEKKQMKDLLTSEGITPTSPIRKRNAADLFKKQMSMVNGMEGVKLVHDKTESTEEPEIREEGVQTQTCEEV